MSKVQSFISEHTAEYFILASLIPSLQCYFKEVIPFFYWAGREGNNLSRTSSSYHGDYKILCIYPRRPKLFQPNSNSIRVKINEYLWPSIMPLIKNDIPVIAGIPNITSLFDANWSCITSSWFQFLQPTLDFEFDLQIQPNLEVKKTLQPYLSNLLTVDDIFKLVEQSHLKSWENILDTIAMSRHGGFRNRTIYGWYGNYRPVFILLR